MANFNALFGGDFMNSYLQGYQLAAMQAKQKQDMLIQQQNMEMNKMLKEEQTMKLRDQRTAIEKAQQWNDEIDKKLMPTTIPAQDLSAWSETNDFTGPSQWTQAIMPERQGPSQIAQDLGQEFANTLKYVPPGNRGAAVIEFMKERAKAATPSMANEPYKIGHIQPFDNPDGTTTYKEYKGKDATGGAIWQDRIDLGGKAAAKGFDTQQEALAEAVKLHGATPQAAGLIPTAEMGPANKWIPKLVPNIELRIPPFMAQANLPPGVTINRKTGTYVQYDPDTNTVKPWNPAGGMQAASLDWQSLKKSAQTVNGPTFKRLIDNAELLSEPIVDKKGNVIKKSELDQIADLRDKIDDGAFGKVWNDLQAFNNWDQWLKYKTSDIPMARLLSKVMADTDTLASVYSGGGTVTSDYKMKFARDLFETGLSKAAFRAKMETHKEAVRDRAVKYAQPNPAGMSQPQGQPTPVAGGKTITLKSGKVIQVEE